VPAVGGCCWLVHAEDGPRGDFALDAGGEVPHDDGAAGGGRLSFIALHQMNEHSTIRTTMMATHHNGLKGS
jgi:hypothetical protein